MDSLTLWRQYKDRRCDCKSLGITLDLSRMDLPEGFFKTMAPAMEQAFEAMRDLEAGEIANPDENRMVGHYWLRAAHMAPNDDLTHDIEQTIAAVSSFADEVHDKTITPPNAAKFTDLLVCGIGGSALGPQLVADALGEKRDKLRPHFLDNTDPDGFDRTFQQLGARLKSTLVVVISKSGGTKETRNAMVETQAAFERAGLEFAKQAVAVTGMGSQLDQVAERDGWLRRFPMWDWVGGRTSVTSAVGLLPMALQGVDWRAFIDGCAQMDQMTRVSDVKENPAALLALSWHHATGGTGEKAMVVLPYKDRLVLLSRYLQQLVMESLGKKHDLDGNVVEQGITVYGNKGSTDQHAFVQQLRDGRHDFFVTFLPVLQDRAPAAAKKAPEVEADTTSGDYLLGFWLGTRDALYEQGRESVSLILNQLDATTLGAIVALYERAVGFYATLVNINAYHQPGVEAGKKAAGEVLDVQKQIVEFMRDCSETLSAEQIADRLHVPHHAETVFHVLEHLATNRRVVKRTRGKYRKR